MNSSTVFIFLVILSSIPASLCLLKNCVTGEEFKKDQINPKCEVVTVFDFDCLAKNQISVQRPQIDESTQPEQTHIKCYAPYPIELEVDGIKLKGFPGVFITRGFIDNSKEDLTDTSKFLYTITVPLIISKYSPRWWKVSRLNDSAGGRTEFYMYSPGPGDRVLPYDRRSGKQPDNTVVAETRFAILPCTVTNPKEANLVQLITYAPKKAQVKVDNTTVKYDPMIGFILDTTADPPPWGKYTCEATSPRTSTLEKLELSLEEPEDFIAIPSSENVHSFSDKPLTLTCKSKAPILMSGTMKNGTKIPKSHFTLTKDETLLLKYVGKFISEPGQFQPAEKLSISCSNESAEEEGKTATHTWSVEVLDIGNNGVLQLTYDGSFIRCSSSKSNQAKASLYNVECTNSVHARSKKQEFELLGVGQCGRKDDTVRCGATCDSDCQELLGTAMYAKGHLKCESSSGISYGINYINGYDKRTYSDLKNIPPEALVAITVPKGSVSSVFVNTTNTYQCTASSFLSHGQFIWKARHVNGTLFTPKTLAVRPIHDYKKNGDSVWEADIRFEEKVVELLCFVPEWNSERWINISIPVQIQDATKPTIINKGDHRKLQIGKKGETMTCHAKGDPTPKLTWHRNGKPVQSPPFQTYQNEEGQVLEFPEMKQELASAYECWATSIGGVDVGEFIAEAYDPPNITLYIGLGVTLLVLLIIILLVLYWKLRRAKDAIRYLTDEEVNHFKYGNPEAARAAKEPHEMIINLPFNPDYEIEKDRLDFDEQNVLGSGAFGVVYKGRLANFPSEVAIKTVKPYSEVSYFKSLLSELKVMGFLGKHENIVQLIGACTANIKERVLYMVVELSPYGNLETYLRFHQKQFSNLIRGDKIYGDVTMVRDLYANLFRQTTRASRTSQQVSQNFSTAELVDWSLQIANGMMHLESKKVIHADLATRNVLLYENGIVKITDFGLSRQLYAYATYMKKEQEPLPWRWMALESLREMNFSTQSDVWGFGVTLWELFSLGAVPYPGLSWSIDFVEKLTQGLRLSKPFYSTQEIYDIMVQCWHTDADQRPTFYELRNLFEGIKMRMMDPNPSK